MSQQWRRLFSQTAGVSLVDGQSQETKGAGCRLCPSPAPSPSPVSPRCSVLLESGAEQDVEVLLFKPLAPMRLSSLMEQPTWTSSKPEFSLSEDPQSSGKLGEGKEGVVEGEREGLIKSSRN